METNFKIVTPAYNCEKWIKKCIDSVKNQNYTNYEHVIVDDCSTDNTLKIAIEETKNDSRFKVIKKESRMGATHSHIAGAQLLCNGADDEDVFVHLDGDDWLAHENVLETVNEVYIKTNCWMTYGNYQATDGSPSVCSPKKPNKPIRHHIVDGGWCFSHLRTFKKFLWENIKLHSLLDSNGKLFSSACDVAMLCPMLEMSGDKVEFINETLYIYNRYNPLNDDKADLGDQVRCALEVAQQTPYTQL